MGFPNGVFNLGLCKFNSSTFISQPHFLDADPYYVNQFVDGSLRPDASKHQTTLVIDPQFGIPIGVIIVMAIFYQVHRLKENKKRGPVLVEGSSDDLRRIGIVREDTSIYTPEEDTRDTVPILTK